MQAAVIFIIFESLKEQLNNCLKAIKVITTFIRTKSLNRFLSLLLFNRDKPLCLSI